MAKPNMESADRLEEILRGQSISSASMGFPCWQPAIDLKQTPDAFTLYVDLPGNEEDDIRVSIKSGSVMVCGVREFDHDNEDAEEFVRIERPYGEFKVEVPLPGTIHEDLIRAKYRKGVLKVWLPRRRQSSDQGV